MMLMTSTFIACDSINLNAHCAERVGGGNINHQKQTTTKKQKTKTAKKGHMVQIHSENRCVFRDLQNATNGSASLIVCGRAFQSLGAELEKARKPNFFGVFFSAALGICRCGCNDERRGHAGTYRGMSSCKYSGAVPL